MESVVIDPEAWNLTVIRAQGLRFMRPEKAWRPIVTVEVDRQSQYETVLGVDGQNPNLKQTFRFYDVQSTSTLQMKVWHRSQSKRKSKKSKLVAAATHSLGDLLKKVQTECAGKSRPRPIDLRLTCQTPSKRGVNSSNSKGRPQNGALLTIKLTPPPSQFESQIQSPLTAEQQSGYSSDIASSLVSSSSSQALNTQIDVQPPSPISESLPTPPGLRRRRKSSKRTRGYVLCSEDDDDDDCVFSGSSDSDYSASGSRSRSQSRSFNSSTSFFEDAVRAAPLDSCFDSYSDTDENTQLALLPPQKDISLPVTRWIAASLLPQHVVPKNVETPDDVPPYIETEQDTPNKLWEKFMGNFTFYLDLRDAHVDSQYESILQRLRMEWTFMGGFLAALGAVDVAVLAVGPGSVIPLSPLSLRAIAASSICTGLGIASLAYFILRYSFAPVSLFRTRAMDLYRSYVFFSLSARVPTLCMVASAVAILVFLGLVAFEVWPVGTVLVAFLVGVIMSLQFLVYGCHMFVRGLIGAVRTIVGGVRRLAGGQSVVIARVPAPSRTKLSRPTAGASTSV